MEDKITELAAAIVARFIDKNNVAANDLPALIRSVRSSLSSAGGQPESQAGEATRPTLAQIRRSITPEYLVSFIDGRRYKTLDKHLARHGLTFERYRKWFGLPDDYPSAAQSYGALRSEPGNTCRLRRRRPRRSPDVPRDSETRCAPPN